MSASTINWGKVIKGAAIAAGAVAVLAFAAESIGDFLKELIGTADTASIEAAGKAAEHADKMAAGVDTLSAAADTMKETASTATSTAASITDPAAKAAAINVAETSTEAVKALEGAKEGIKPAVDMADKAAENAAKLASEKNTGVMGTLANNKEVAIAGAAGVGGLIAAHAHGKNEAQSNANEAAEQESFAQREEARRAQALMVARMQAQGYQPAMAMNQGQMR